VVRSRTSREEYPRSADCKSLFLQPLTEELFTPTRLDRHLDGGKNNGVPQEERVLIDEVERRLAEKYAALPSDQIAAVVQHAYARFQSSRVRDFIPLLVERRAHEELEELSVLSPDLAAVALGDLGVASSKTVAV
jgi:hypothetical protein